MDPYRDIVEESMRLEREVFKQEKRNKEISWELRMKKKLGIDESGKTISLFLERLFINLFLI